MSNDKHVHDHEAGKSKVQAAINQHSDRRERFKAFCNAVIDNAETLVTATPEARAAAIAHLRANLDGAWDTING